MKLVAVIPTYNEADHLGALLEQLFAQPLSPATLHVLVVDDGSPDGTAAIADAAARRWPGRIAVLRRAAKQGLASAYVAGIDRALQDGAELILQMDADGSHEPAALPRLLAAIADADLAIGSRYAAGDSRDFRDRYHGAVSRWVNRAVGRCLPHLAVRDTTSGFRLWRRAALLRIDAGRAVRTRDYGFQVEMTVLAAAAGCRLVEVPIHFQERHAGTSKMTLPVQLHTAWEIAGVAWRQRGRARAAAYREREADGGA